MIPVFAVKRLQEIGQDGFETADVREIVPGRFQVDYRNQVPGMGLQASVEVLELRLAGTMGAEVMIEPDFQIGLLRPAQGSAPPKARYRSAGVTTGWSRSMPRFRISHRNPKT